MVNNIAAKFPQRSRAGPPSTSVSVWRRPQRGFVRLPPMFQTAGAPNIRIRQKVWQGIKKTLKKFGEGMLVAIPFVALEMAIDAIQGPDQNLIAIFNNTIDILEFLNATVDTMLLTQNSTSDTVIASHEVIVDALNGLTTGLYEPDGITGLIVNISENLNYEINAQLDELSNNMLDVITILSNRVMALSDLTEKNLKTQMLDEITPVTPINDKVGERLDKMSNILEQLVLFQLNSLPATTTTTTTTSSSSSAINMNTDSSSPSHFSENKHFDLPSPTAPHDNKNLVVSYLTQSKFTMWSLVCGIAISIFCLLLPIINLIIYLCCKKRKQRNNTNTNMIINENDSESYTYMTFRRN